MIIPSMQIHFESDFSIVDPTLIGKQLAYAAISQGNCHLSQRPLDVHVTSSEMILNFLVESSSNKRIIYKLKLTSRRSIGDVLWGFEMKQVSQEWFHFASQEGHFRMFHFLNDLTNTITGIYAYGEEDHTEITGQESILALTEGADIVPEAIALYKKTLLLLAFQFNSTKWMYILPSGLSDFHLFLDVPDAPEVFASKHLPFAKLKLLASAS